jgi:hypothetical protein
VFDSAFTLLTPVHMTITSSDLDTAAYYVKQITDALRTSTEPKLDAAVAAASADLLTLQNATAVINSLITQIRANQALILAKLP